MPYPANELGTIAPAQPVLAAQVVRRKAAPGKWRLCAFPDGNSCDQALARNRNTQPANAR